MSKYAYNFIISENNKNKLKDKFETKSEKIKILKKAKKYKKEIAE